MARNRAWLVARAIWNWLLGKPIDAGGAIAVQAAADSVDDVATTVENLIDALAKQKAVLQQAESLVAQTQGERDQHLNDARALVKSGDDEEAQSILYIVEAIETNLPGIEAQRDAAAHQVSITEELLGKQRQLLQQMKTEQSLNESKLRLAQSMEESNAAMGLTSESAVQQFKKAKEAVNRRTTVAQAGSEVRFGLGRTERKLKKLSASDRLAQMKQDVLEGGTNNNA